MLIKCSLSVHIISFYVFYSIGKNREIVLRNVNFFLNIYNSLHKKAVAFNICCNGFFHKYLTLQFLILDLTVFPFPENKKERETGIEPATPSLARRCSTAEPLAHFMRCSSQRRLYYHMLYFVSTTFFIFLSNFKDNRKPERFLLSPISIDINYFSAITLITTILPH